jgi:hypothetical protein
MQEAGTKCTDNCKAPDGWLLRFQLTQDVGYKMVSADSRNISQESVGQWTDRVLPAHMHGMKQKCVNTHNRTLSYSLLLDKSSVTKQKAHKGRKK